MQEVMTTKQLASYLQLNELTIYKRVRIGEIPAVRFGRALRFKKAVIDKWLEAESGWDLEFEGLLLKSQEFGKKAGISEQAVQKAVKQIRRQRG